jgi:amino acid transporter
VSLQRWHWGKIVILWAWGGVIVSLLLTAFFSRSAAEAPAVSTASFVGSLVILIALTAVTWLWLGGKERAPRNER